jgi:oxygen-independent coproporphyrinogen-3 oxidase
MILPPLTLYVHLPWCVRKCPYCDFNSHATGSAVPSGRYLDALRNDLAQEALRAGDRPIESIFIGGGTPSLFAPDEIGSIISAVHELFAVVPECEITMEANPGTVECGALAAYRSAGVNRLSLGAQSFDRDLLARLGRIHGPEEIFAAVKAARAAGFASLNIDIMFALPGQTLEMALADVAAVCRLLPEHVSYYQLTLEPNTVFFNRPPEGLPDDELSWAMQEQAHARLQAAGYRQYEISAFARDGHRCRHNLNYWCFGDYLAAGAGAHGKLSATDGSIRRYRKPAHPLSYMEAFAGGPVDTAMETLPREDLGFEFMLNALRLPEGFSSARFAERTGLPAATLAEPLRQASADGLIRQATGDIWQPTALGLRFLNDLQARFLP